MSQPSDGYAARLGQPGDWGLTSDSFAPLRDELADHLHCIAREEGAPTADDSAQSLATPTARRKLTSTRIADQVYATLHRRPTKQEWRELGWLLFWYSLTILSDLLAARATQIPGLADFVLGRGLYFPSGLDQVIVWGAWLIQGVARAGFFTAFGVSLWRAYQTGLGVLVARLLQLKLIHVVLVVVAGLAFGAAIYGAQGNYGFFNEYVYFGGPTWLTAPFIFGVLLLVGIALLFQPQVRSIASFMILLAVFLYPAGPVASRQVQTRETWIKNGFFKLEDGTLAPEITRQVMDPKTGIVRGYKPDQIKGKRILATLPNTLEHRKVYFAQLSPEYQRHPGFRIDLEINERIWSHEAFLSYPVFNIKTWKRSGNENYREWEQRHRAELRLAEPISQPRLQGPLAAVGAGIGWLAAPIPVLTVVGLVLLVAIMGRRSLLAFLLYVILASAALILTITPFFIGQTTYRIFEFGPMGLVHSPFPGFETLMLASLPELLKGDFLMITVIVGLLLSSGVPWLLTSLFLKPGNSSQVHSGPEVAA